MKKTALICIMAYVCSAKILAQCTGNNTNTNPFTNASTNLPWATPTAQNPSPNYPWANFQANTFDWTAPNFQSTQTGNPFPNGGLLNSPFWSSQNAGFYSNRANSDFRPEDGWELIKQDFGYFYGVWQNTQPPKYLSGGWNASIMGTSPFQIGDPQQNATTGFNYFVLYNKYSGILRVATFIPNPNDKYASLYVKLRFLTKDDYTQTPSYQPKVNALFNHYNTTVSRPLDQQTLITEVSAPAIFPSNGLAEFTHADFQLAYDPCVCEFQSGFEVDFYALDTATVTLKGVWAGVSNIKLSSVFPGQQPQINSNNFISSVFENGGAPETAILNYNNLTNAGTSAGGDVQTGLNVLATLLGIGSDFGEAAAVIGTGGAAAAETAGASYLLSAASSTKVKDGLDAASKIVSFFSGVAGQVSNVAPPGSLSIESGYLQATGRISYPPYPFPGTYYKIGVPGSIDAGTLPEYAPVNNGETLPNYPMYNEPMGLFALLQTPTVNLYKHSPAQNNYGQINFAGLYSYPYFPPSPGSGGPGDYGYYHSQFYYGDAPSIPAAQPNTTAYTFPATADYYTVGVALSQNLVYAFSPLVDLTNSKVYVALEVNGLPIGTNGNYSYKSSVGFENDLLPPVNPKRIRRRTVSYPLSCATNIYAEEKYNYYQNYISGTDQSASYCTSLAYAQGSSGTTSCSPQLPSSYFLNNTDLTLMYGTDDIRLVVMLDLITKPDVYGKVHRTTQIIKYNCDVNISATVDPTSTTAGTAALTALASPTNLGLNTNTTYTSTKDIFSYGNLFIYANEIANSGTVVNFTAENEIQIKTGSPSLNPAFKGNINLYLQSLPNVLVSSCENNVLTPLVGSNLKSYCTNTNAYAASTGNTGYSANLRSANSVTKSNPAYVKPSPFINTSSKLGTNIKLNIFPNPTSDKVYLDLSVQNTGSLLVNISDLNGNQLIHNIFYANEGASRFKLDLSSLKSGAYFINITDEDGVPIKNDKLILMN